MIRPRVELAIAFNEAVREDDEWFEEPDDLERLAAAFGEANNERLCCWHAGCWTGTGETGASSSPPTTFGWPTS